MAKLVSRKFFGMAKMKILCLGNNSEDTANKAQMIAMQYTVPLNGLLIETVVDILPGCYYTDIGTVTRDYLKSICKEFDLLILLDQDPLSYGNLLTFDMTLITCIYLKKWQKVIIQSEVPWCYMVTYFNPLSNNCQIIKIKTNQELWQQVMITDLSNRNVVLQLSKVHDNSFYDFTKYVNEIVLKCRTSNTKFVMFRADVHEQDELHSNITKFLVQFPEFVLLTPGAFVGNVNLNLEKIILQHWQDLYE
jgi:hypothetical protein